MKKKIKKEYTKSSDPESLIFLEMLLEEGHVPRAVVIANKKSKKVKKSEEKT
tara:strand:+ start:579 stop:734 length:156 start_codon:yes stop_codon:yes gene_type:complete